MNASFACVACVLLPLLAGCGGADPSDLTGGRHTVGSDPTAPAADPAADPANSSSGSSGSSGTSSSGGTDAGDGTDGGSSGSSGSSGTSGTPPPANAFTGAAAFVSKMGPSARKSAHNFAGNTPPTSPKGQACSGCHGFFMGGTVYADVAGTLPAAGVEVRARDSAGVAVSAWTDQDGNFYIPNAGGVKLPASVGVRNAATTKLMSATVANGTCASTTCHVAGKQGPIHLP